MDPVQRAVLDPTEGIHGNVDRSTRRQVTLLDRDAWTRTMSDLGADIDPSARRANVLLSGMDLANARDNVLAIGNARLLIGGEVTPCTRMNDVLPGLQDAMRAEWRGGVFAQILQRSEINVGDAVAWRTETSSHGVTSYRKAELSDIEALSALRSEDEGGGAPARRMSAYLAGEHHPQKALAQRIMYYVTNNGQPVGYIAGHLTQRFDCKGELQWLYVAESHRNYGVGGALLGKLAIWFVQRGARRVCVNVDPANTIARSFYRKHSAIELSEHWQVWTDIAAAI